MTRWTEAQDAIAAALVADPPTGWVVRPTAGFPGMDVLDTFRAGILWVDDDMETGSFGGETTASDGGVVPIDESFTVTVAAYKASTVSRVALRDAFAALELALFEVLLGPEFATGPGIDLVLSGRSYKPGLLDERTWDGFYTLTFTWRG